MTDRVGIGKAAHHACQTISATLADPGGVTSEDAAQISTPVTVASAAAG